MMSLMMFLHQRVERSRPQTPEELMGVVEGVRAMEALIQAADESQRESSQQNMKTCSALRLCVHHTEHNKQTNKHSKFYEVQ